ncbi:MAG: hypothetical protein Q4Q14_00070 [Methanobrevibacter sp.]|nr:hypothetical protein [Methanobrevibacter sp.]
MRRKKDDKRVLVSPRETRKKANKRQLLGNRNRRIRNANNYNNNVKKSKTSKITLFLMIFALVAFVVGAGLGMIWNAEDNTHEAPHWINVTEEMTTNLNDTEPVYYDASVDDVDFNSNQTLTELNATSEPSY